MGYVSHAQRKAVWASKKDGGKGNPNKKSPAKMKKSEDMSKPKRQRTVREAVIGRISDPISYDPKSKELKENPVPHNTDVTGLKRYNKKSPAKMGPVAAMVAGKVAGKVVDKAMEKSPFKLKPKSPLMSKISASCKARAKKKFKVWPSAYASGWGVRCTQGKV